MRVVGGEFRGRAILAPDTKATRPTSDRVRESLFDILVHRFGDPVSGGHVLDLFAGSGALGLEAMSRGAEYCLFVEDAAAARGVIRHNVEALGLTGSTRIFRRDATRLGTIGKMKPFDLAFVDPPYGRGLGEAALAAAVRGNWLRPGALCVLEETAQAQLESPAGLDLLEERSFGDTRLVFFRTSKLP